MGTIGGLLGALDPPQHYTHMGIFDDDGFSVRHCTMCDDQVNDAIGGVGDLVGKLALHEAFSDLQTLPLRYGWPGSITQTVHAAWQSERDESALTDDDKFYDGATTKNHYAIKALSFYPERVGSTSSSTEPGGDSAVLEPLVVKPCREMETRQPVLRELLHRIADAADALRCHYRFFAYTRAGIAFDNSEVGPPMAETTLPDPEDRCKQIPVTETIPAVCSTFVWAAAEKVSIENKPGLLLDPPATRKNARPGGPCQSFYSLPGNPNSDFADGLYDYSEPERERAGQHMNDGLKKSARDSVAAAVGLGSTGSGVRNFLYNFAPAFVLDWTKTITNLTMTDPIVAILDIQDRIANITCNLFASDSSRDNDDWKHPGSGVSVSPDDIASWWQPNSFLSDVSCDGLFGQSVRAKFRPPTSVQRPPQRWELSKGPGAVAGRVRLNKDNRIPVGALIDVACRSATANSDGVFDIDAPQGTYLIHAQWTDPATDWVWEGQGVVDIPFWGRMQLDEDLLLDPPAEERRDVRVLAHADVVNRHTFGHDWWDHRDTADDLYLTDENSGKVTNDNKTGRYPYNSGSKGFPVEDIGVATIDYQANWPDKPDPNDPFAVVFTLSAMLHEHGAIMNEADAQVTIGSGHAEDVKIELTHQTAFEAPEHVWITMRIVNERIA
jgi:hypothetical protein